jgi:DNA-binding MarR family transcriptional regulator/GNAT superfamily N-acetyltransferase
MDVISEVRQFNRFYTRLIGLLDEHLPGSGFSLTEGRVIYELATGGTQTAADLTRRLGIDKAQLSRVLRTLEARRIVTSKTDAAHAKRKMLSLTKAGRVVFSRLDKGSRVRMESLLNPLAGATRRQLVASMRDIQAAFEAETNAPAPVTLRGLVPGDVGWVVHRQAVLYTQEYGWDWTYEALMSKIFAEYVAHFDPSKEDGWIAERAGQIVGSIFLMKSEDPEVARLRLLYVEPHARGAGVGRLLVQTCIARARQLGYRRLTLWTNDVLTAARRIYETSGFRLTNETAHRSFGKDLVGQTWDLEL